MVKMELRKSGKNYQCFVERAIWSPLVSRSEVVDRNLWVPSYTLNTVRCTSDASTALKTDSDSSKKSLSIYHSSLFNLFEQLIKAESDGKNCRLWIFRFGTHLAL